MRQIHVCAWLLVMSLAATACGGEKFTASDQNGPPNDDPLTTSGASSKSRNHAGTGGGAGSFSISGGGTAASNGGTSSNAAGNGTGGGAVGSGGTSSAGTSSSAGATGSGGDSADACPEGTVTFHMLPAPDLGHDYLCDAGCGTGWLTLTDAEGGKAFSIFSACGTASCEACEVQPCAAAACVATPLTGAGAKLQWTGTYMEKGTCGANMACQEPACVKPGKYKARACAAINAGTSGMGGSCTPKNEQLCAEAVFEFPSTQTVQLVLKK